MEEQTISTAELYKEALDNVVETPHPDATPDGYFNYNTEYAITHIEEELAIPHIMDKHVHVYTSTCKCVGNAIKIDVTGHFTTYERLETGEVIYTMVSDPDDMGASTYASIGTRSTFLRFNIVKD